MEVFLFAVATLYNRPQGDALVFAATSEVRGYTPVAHVDDVFYYVALITDDSLRQELLTSGNPIRRDFSEIASSLSEPDLEDIQAMSASLQAIALHPNIIYPREILRVIEERFQREF